MGIRMTDFFNAFVASVQPIALLYISLGVIVSIVAGALPGITTGMTVALTLPLTYYMSSQHAIFLLVAMYVGGVSGGLITATLLNIPGTPASMMTTLDGYPMARRGEAGRAIGLGISASFLGGLISWVFLVILSPPLAALALQFSHFEYFAMVVMALVFIGTLSEGSVVKGVLSGLIGMLLALPGVDPVSAKLRLDFGVPELANGFQMLPVLIGLFSIPQIIQDTLDIEQVYEKVRFAGRSMFLTIADFKRHWRNLVRSSLIGTWIGFLPGIGAAVGSIVAYSTAKTLSKTPDKFGTGFEDGIVASEAANNATIGGALIPLITLGIPGSITDVILMAALILHNVTPGPLLFRTNPEIAYGIMSSMFVANVVMLAFMLVTTVLIARLIDLPKVYVIPPILLFCMVGAFAINNQAFDVWVMLGAGLLGFVLQRCGVPLGPFAIGFILAPMAETSLRSGLMASQGSFLPLITRPWSCGFVVISLLTLCWPFFRSWWQSREER
jgi:putative tricarboxylic transport membrane protein